MDLSWVHAAATSSLRDMSAVLSVGPFRRDERSTAAASRRHQKYHRAHIHMIEIAIGALYVYRECNLGLREKSTRIFVSLI